MSCREYAPYSDEEMFGAEYQHNFIRLFGEIDPDQSWDFSAAVSRKEKSLSPDTRAGESLEHLYSFEQEVNDSWYYVDGKLIADIGALSIPQNKDCSFALLVDEEDCFDIYPIYQNGKAVCGFEWKFQAVIDGVNIVNAPAGGLAMGSVMQLPISNGKYSGSVGSNAGFSTAGGRTLPFLKFINTGMRRHMFLNLSISGSAKYENTKLVANGTQQSSLNNQMQIVDLPKPANISDAYECLFVACEVADCDKAYPFNIDNRYRSLIFMVVGPKDHFPDVSYVRQDDDGVRRWLEVPMVCKRYMIEDLGSVSDFDFNDIVVDVSRTEVEEVRVSYSRPAEAKTDVHQVSLVKVNQETTASICHLCGTRPFLLTVGEHEFEKVEDPTKVSLPISSLVNGWDPEQNNVSVTVWPTEAQTTQGGWNVSFPKVGQVPYIMAMPIWMPWTQENEMFTGWQDLLL